MIISFTTVFAIATGALLCGILLGASALLAGRAGLREARAARAAADSSALRLAEMEAALARVAGQLETLLAEREQAAAAPTRPSLREAVALSRHGASTEELVATCRIGQSEARLIQMLYGATRRADEAAHGSEVH